MRLAAAELRSKGHQVWYPQFPSPETPDPVEWQEILSHESAMMDEFEGEEKVCIAHSLGAINWLFGALNNIYNKPFDRVLLVAPPDPEMTEQAEGLNGEPLKLSEPDLEIKAKSWAKEILIIASDHDKWLPKGVYIYQLALGVETIVFPSAGHFSLDDGWGRWKGVSEWAVTGDRLALLKR